MRREVLNQLKIPMNPSGNRNNDFTACSAVPQPTAAPRVPYFMAGLVIFTVHSANSCRGTLTTLGIITCFPVHWNHRHHHQGLLKFSQLTFWRRIFFLQILAHPVFKM